MKKISEIPKNDKPREKLAKKELKPLQAENY